MREVSIGEFRAKFKDQLGDLPVAVTRHGRILGIFCTKDDYEKKKFVQTEVRKESFVQKVNSEGTWDSSVEKPRIRHISPVGLEDVRRERFEELRKKHGEQV